MVKHKVIGIERNKLEEKLIFSVAHISLDYPKIPTFIMIEMVRKFNAYCFREDYLEKYKIKTTNDPKLQKIFDNLRPQAMDLLNQNISGIDKKIVRKNDLIKFAKSCKPI